MFADPLPTRRAPEYPAEMVGLCHHVACPARASDSETIDAVTFDLRWKTLRGCRSLPVHFTRRR